jgi:hypothetical protein
MAPEEIVASGLEELAIEPSATPLHLVTSWWLWSPSTVRRRHVKVSKFRVQVQPSMTKRRL